MSGIYNKYEFWKYNCILTNNNKQVYESLENRLT